MTKRLKFPEEFLWGSATSAYQVEGGIENCDWAKVYPAGIACDHYNLYKEDFDLIKKLNQTAFRFSIEWSRIEPEPGRFDEKELEHYWQVLHALKSRGIKTMVTLHHFTLPFWLAKIGGFASPKAVFYFSRFAERIFDEYYDMVDFWITFNEPLIYATNAHFRNCWPPQKRNLILFFKVIKNQIESHKRIYNVFHNISGRARYKIFHKSRFDVKVGIAKNNIFFEPFNSKSPFDKFSVLIARYFCNERLLNKIKNHLDFIGLNYYFHNRIKFPFLIRNENKIVSDINWEIFPQGIYYVLKELRKYNLPIYITENGVADSEDKLRKDFIKEHLFWLHKAIEEGVDVRGYFHWSLMDNFEWEKGFEPRFGLIEIDYETLERKPRSSAFYYAQICKNNNLAI